MKRIVFASTGGAIYGNIESGKADENTPENPQRAQSLARE